MADVRGEKGQIRPACENPSTEQAAVSVEKGELINASGHVQQLDRNLNLFMSASLGLVDGNVWPAVGGSILVAIFNARPPGKFDARAIEGRF